MKISELTSFHRDALVVVSEDDGGKTAEEIEAKLEDEVYEGGMYHTRRYLDNLVGKGLLYRSEIDRRTNEYKITPLRIEVLEEYQQWLNGKINHD